MRWLCLLLCLFSVGACEPEGAPFNGYVEGEYLYLAPTSGGLLEHLSVARGEKVKEGDPLFAIDKTALEASYMAAKAEVAQAQSTWTNLLKGSRPEEIEIIMQQQEQARVSLDAATKEFARVKALIDTKAVSQQDLDNASAAFESAQSRVAELAAQLKKATLGAREDEIAAAKSAIDIAEQKVVQYEKLLHEASPTAPSGGSIEDTFFNVGEYVGAGKPVVSLLPPNKVKIRFFVPQAKLAHLPLGQRVDVACDGCPHSFAAKVTFISSSSEYTPPVIYSVESRDKLVFMVEATPDAFDPMLRPGLPVDIYPVAP